MSLCKRCQVAWLGKWDDTCWLCGQGDQVAHYYGVSPFPQFTDNRGAKWSTVAWRERPDDWEDDLDRILVRGTTAPDTGAVVQGS